MKKFNFYKKKISFFLFVAFFSCCYVAFAQEKEYLKDGTIEEQIDFVIEKSSNWDIYKLITRSWMTTLKKSVMDSLNITKTEITTQKRLIIEKETEIKNLQDALQETKEHLNVAQNEKDTITVMGGDFSKGVFLTTTILIILALAVLLVLIFGLYKRNAAVLSKISEELDVTNKEFEDYRQESRKKHEQLVVQHHREIKKLKGM